MKTYSVSNLILKLDVLFPKPNKKWLLEITSLFSICTTWAKSTFYYHSGSISIYWCVSAIFYNSIQTNASIFCLCFTKESGHTSFLPGNNLLTPVAENILKSSIPFSCQYSKATVCTVVLSKGNKIYLPVPLNVTNWHDTSVYLIDIHRLFDGRRVLCPQFPVFATLS